MSVELITDNDVEMRFCKFCDCEHPDTKEYWTIPGQKKSSECKKKTYARWAKKHYAPEAVAQRKEQARINREKRKKERLENPKPYASEKYCKYCQVIHPRTAEFWVFYKNGAIHYCIVKGKAEQKKSFLKHKEKIRKANNARYHARKHLRQPKPIPSERYCNHCKINHPTTEEHWIITKSKRGATLFRCKEHSTYLKLQKPEKLRANARKFYHANKEKCIESGRKYKLANKEKVAKQRRARAKEPHVKDRYRAYMRAWTKAKSETDPTFKLVKSLRNRVRQAIKGEKRPGHTLEVLGCTPTELMAHLESKFQPGMSWGNYGKGQDKWHVDHIIPISWFDLTDPEQFKKACHYTNLQPLWQTENVRKNNLYAGRPESKIEVTL